MFRTLHSARPLLAAAALLAGAPGARAGLIADGPDWRSLGDVTAPGDPVSHTAPVGNGLSGQGAAYAIDNDPDTLFFHLGETGAGFIVTPAVGPTIVQALTFTTAGDQPKADPASVTLEGSNNGGATWHTILADRSLYLPWDRQVRDLIGFPNDRAYTSYRVFFPTRRDPAAADHLAFGEIELLGTPVPTPATLTLLGIGATLLVPRRKTGGAAA